MNYTIREIKENEYGLLNEFLYEVNYVPAGFTLPDWSVLDTPELRICIENFHKKFVHICLVAEVDGKIIGAVWARVMKDFGNIDDNTPSLAISLYPEYRHHGIGTDMMRQMFALLKKNGYQRVSLSVRKDNYAVKMYQSLGFEVIVDNSEEYIMLKQL